MRIIFGDIEEIREFKKKASYLRERFQHKINRTRDNLLDKLESSEQKLTDLRNKTLQLENDLKISEQTEKLKLDKKYKELQQEKEEFNIWCENIEKKLQLREKNLNELETNLKERMEELAKAKYGEFIQENFSNLVDSVVKSKGKETILLSGDKIK